MHLSTRKVHSFIEFQDYLLYELRIIIKGYVIYAYPRQKMAGVCVCFFIFVNFDDIERIRNYMAYIQTIKNYLANSFGKRTKYKLICFLVDDYGGVRTRNIDAVNAFRKAGISIQNRCLFDTLANEEDLTRLFEVLSSVKDSRGNCACFTPLTNIANPDFDRIKESGFSNYYREPFTTTLDKYGLHDVIGLWKEGISSGLFHPEYHGTEHVPIKYFMNALRSGHESSMLAFENESIRCPLLPHEKEYGYTTKTFQIETASDNEPLKDDIRVGLKMFNDIIGYRPSIFTPGAGEYSPLLHQTLAEEGIKYLDVHRYYQYPLGDGKFTKRFMYDGKKTEYGQYYYVRNVCFEPISEDGSFCQDCVDFCLNKISAAFAMRSPAIISSHRVNFVTGISRENGEYGITKLKQLLDEIQKRWPDALFVTGYEMMQILFEHKVL